MERRCRLAWRANEIMVYELTLANLYHVDTEYPDWLQRRLNECIL